MFLYKNGRFYAGPFSFALPGGFYLDNESPDAFYNTVMFFSPDHTFLVHMTIETATMDAHAAAENDLDECDPEEILQTVTPITHPLPGYEVSYRSDYSYESRNQYYSAHFDGGDGQAQESCTVYVTSSVPIDQVLSHPGFQALFASIRLEPQEA